MDGYCPSPRHLRFVGRVAGCVGGVHVGVCLVCVGFLPWFPRVFLEAGSFVNRDSDICTGWPDNLMRPLTIQWPTDGRPLHAAEISLFEYPSGQQIFSVTDMSLHASAGNVPILAELTMIVGVDGLPLLGDAFSLPEESLHPDGSPRTGVFWWSVVGMRTAS